MAQQIRLDSMVRAAALALAMSTGLWISAVHALQVEQLVPQGVVDEVRQVVLRTDADAVRFGHVSAADETAPALVQCSDPTLSTGTPRWNNAREWVWQFEQPVPAGTSCIVVLEKSFKSATGQSLKGKGSYRFEVAGPTLLQTWPETYMPLDEEQIFVLRLNAVATRESLLEHVHCRAQQVGERIPVRWIDGADREDVLAGLELTKTADKYPGQYITLACNRRLAAGSAMQLIYGAGVRTVSGIIQRESKTLDFTVREPFAAQLQCERERANADCMPIRDVRLTLSAPVSRALAQQVRLSGEGKTLEPILEDNTDPVYGLRFSPPLQPLGTYLLELPTDFQDDAGRTLTNASAFPMTVKMGDSPALAKFAAAPFGVIERYAEGEDNSAVLPVTVRKVEGMSEPAPADQAAQVRSLRLETDADIIHWWNLVQRYHAGHVARDIAHADLQNVLPSPVDAKDRDSVATRTLSLLKTQAHVQNLALPAPQEGDPRPFEVVGIALEKPGFHVVEIESPRLGASLLDERLGESRSMFVRTSALVTNLSVHLKLGQQSSAVWVTSLDKGQPVGGADVQVSDCRGNVHASGMTDKNGLLVLPELERQAPLCEGWESSGNWFVSARFQANGTEDIAFVWSDWQRGIEPWRFNLPVGWGHQAKTVVHTVMDRALVRAGETVSMKHFVRLETAQGLVMPKSWPAQAIITHVGSGQQYTRDLQWQETPSGGKNATMEFVVPPAAKLGLYTVALRWMKHGEGDGSSEAYHYDGIYHSGEFRVEAFRVPVLQGSVHPVSDSKGPLVQPGQLPVAVSLNYLDGGTASGQQVQISALLREQWINFERWVGYSFLAPRHPQQDDDARNASDPEEAATADNGRLLADKLALTLDAQGQGQVVLPAMPVLDGVQELVLEASFADPNGEIQTIRSSQNIWPSAVVAGIRTDGWVAVSRKMRFQALAVDTSGQPQAGVPLTVEAVLHTTTSTRKRLVGGFYSYDNQQHSKPLGQICSGKSDARGLLLCETTLAESGEVELIVTANDAQGRKVQAADTVWVTGQGELWFGGQDHDRMDVLPEKASYVPGEIAKLQVRMPFREATALVTIEREGILQSQVIQLKGSEPTFTLPVQDGWGPNVYVSVLALRGRLYEVPWYSFFTWGYKTPRVWWSAFWNNATEYVAPTAMVDLSKPAFRLGVAELKVDDQSQQLQVQVTTDRRNYQVRDTARITIRAVLADGSPAKGAEVALAVVDKALLELAPNTSWQLREGLWQRRDWSVATATAQMEVVGRRHYGRKAAPPGGGGGTGAPTRELLDTLLLWQPRIILDAQGQAQVDFPLNDVLSSFDIVAVADAGVQHFGTGSTTIQTTQDLQIISGLPPVVREGDEFQAVLTVRNTTAQPMEVQLRPQATSLSLEAQTLQVPPGQAREAVWDVKIPLALEHSVQGSLHWTIEARDKHTGTSDTLTAVQGLLPAVPLTVRQATLIQVEGNWSQAVERPKTAVVAKGGLRLSFSERLADAQSGVPGLREWWMAYPYIGLEQTIGKAIGLNDAILWADFMQQLPSYLDEDGLVLYFPQQDGQSAQGSDVLTAYLLAVADEIHRLDPRFVLPAAEQMRMEFALINFVTGHIERQHWAPQKDLDVRKLAAIAALTRTGKATPKMLESLRIDPQSWPTHAVIDWLDILQRMDALPQRTEHLQRTWQVLKNRLSYQGTQLGFSTDEQDKWWWLMQGPDTNAARLLLATLSDSSWDGERARMVAGLLARQRYGAWSTTTANTWAGLALRQFSRQYEADNVSGNTTAMLGAGTQTVNWDAIHKAQAKGMDTSPAQAAQAQASLLLPSGSAALDATLLPGTLFLSWGERSQADLRIQHRGTGKPWVAVQSLAAVPETENLDAGYRIRKRVTAVQQKVPTTDSWRRGDIVRVQLEIDASSDMAWVVVGDPIPAGAMILGSGLGRDASISVRDERVDDKGVLPSFIEHGQDSYRAYWSYLPQGKTTLEYTLRLNNVGDFALPPTRVEALYAPEMFGEFSNARFKVIQP